MPQNEGSPHDGAPHEGFEEELGAVLRSTGEGFSVDGRRELVEGGLTRGRRRVVRRRLAVTGGALALAAVGIGGVYGGSLVGPTGKATTAGVAAAPKPKAQNETGAVDPALRGGQAQIPVKDIAAVIKANTPAGDWQFDNVEAKGQAALGIYDDGDGEAAVSVGLYRAGGGDGEAGAGQVECPSRVHVDYDRCATGRLPGGDRLMVIQGYVYPDKREETKSWRAVLLTKDGFLIDASEYNAPAEKGAAISRENPPFTATQLKALVTSDDWRPLLKKLPKDPKSAAVQGAPQAPAEPAGDAVRTTLRSLLPQGLTVTDKGGDGEYGFVVVDDGKGKSLVEINVQPDMSNVAGDLFGSGDVTVLPDGRKVKVTQETAEKGGSGVVSWTVDTITPEGFRVVVFTRNSGGYREAATRAEPALTVAQLKEIALSLRWQKLPTK
ncbi:hypothetical protein ASC82_25325 [Streptomyces sp. Root431]|uniref:hypothetical protein n=1 Tax=Streptomyces sp. Root431 TaxID=1736535 RepID=UPI0007020710|nr:hypothetical protein [Streptomyces sp. Root431]KQX09267.1 hypothetical protein ASC82_25325 [Streptomyces sp. Root431]